MNQQYLELLEAIECYLYDDEPMNFEIDIYASCTMGDGLDKVVYFGADTKSYSRPMFQVLDDHSFASCRRCEVDEIWRMEDDQCVSADFIAVIPDEKHPAIYKVNGDAWGRKWTRFHPVLAARKSHP